LRREDPRRPVREQEPDRRAAQRDEQALDQNLPDQQPPVGAEGDFDASLREWSIAHNATGKKARWLAWV